MNFEKGFGWVKRDPVISICRSYLDCDTLPKPLSQFQVTEVDDSRFAQRFLQRLSVLFVSSATPPANSDDLEIHLISLQHFDVKCTSIPCESVFHGTGSAGDDITEKAFRTTDPEKIKSRKIEITLNKVNGAKIELIEEN